MREIKLMELHKELELFVRKGLLVKIFAKGKIGWIDSRSKKPKLSIVLAGKFR